MKTLATALSLALLAACATQEPSVPSAAFRVGWTGMPDNSMLPQKSAGNVKTNPNCLGDNVSPPIQWSNAPDKTRSFVILMDDQAGRVGLGVSHMVVYGIPANVSSFAEGELSSAPQGGRFVAGKSTPGLMGWFGPCPPRGNAPQHYVMTMIATALEPSKLAPGLTKAEVLKALEGGKTLRAASYAFRYAH
jgi:Raf kinase inhibitor-like YbhB/YbcL family protein